MKVWKVKAVRGHGWVRNMVWGEPTITATEVAAQQFTREQAERVVEVVNALKGRVPMVAVEVEVDGPQWIVEGVPFEFDEAELQPRNS